MVTAVLPWAVPLLLVLLSRPPARAWRRRRLARERADIEQTSRFVRELRALREYQWPDP